MELKSKVLVSCPTFSGMEYCLSEFIDRIKKLSYSNYEILIVDNSLDDLYFNKILAKGIKSIWDNIPEKDKFLRLIHSRNFILDYALENNFDYILMMDQDVIPPTDIIDRLLSSNKDIISGVYLNYFTSSNQTKVLPVAWMPITYLEFEEMKAKGITFPKETKFEDLSRHITEEELNSNKILKVLHPSAGCMLLSKKAFSNIRYDLTILGKEHKNNMSDDFIFRKNAEKLGFEIFLDTSVKCNHLVLGKYTLSGKELLHPLFSKQ
jgi:glycosyltransferase involved in cell wall biosynthesis